MSKALRGLMRRRMLFAAIAAITVFASVYGFAASLGVSSNKLSAGNAAVASCQSAQTNASYTIAYDSTLGSYKVASVVVGGLTAACNSLPISVSLNGTSNAQLGEVTGNTGTGTSVALAVPAGTHIDASAVQGLSVAING